jgi:AP-1 complex subunit mu
MPASAIYFLDAKGKILISRNYRSDVPQAVVARFIDKLLEEDEVALAPIIEEEGITYLFVKHHNIYVLAITDRNADAAMVLVTLYKVIGVLTEYFNELEEESIKDNFVIIYELLDEMIDFGYPQVTEAKLLQEYITQESYKIEKKKAPSIPSSVTGEVNWRAEGIKYRKNEVFLDVVEKINLLVNANGTVLRSEIVGAIKMKSFLSGMPELRLGLNDRVVFSGVGAAKAPAAEKAIEMEDVNFHQCVRLNRFETDRTISFIPPDGEFDLLTYRLSTQVRPLIWVEAIIDRHAHSRVEYMVKAKSQFKMRSTANNVEIIVPVPADADSPKWKASFGTCRYVPAQNAIIWSIKQFQGGKEFLMRAHFGLPSIVNEEDAAKRPPIQVKFEIPYFTVSGIQVRYLKVIEKSGYEALPWVRYITQSGDYQVRIN